MTARHTLEELNRQVTNCKRCPRLVEWRERVAREKRAAYADWDYWGRPVPGFGDPGAWLFIVGLAPAAHGANRTGRMFTGDRSGDFLYAALHRAGLANQAESTSGDDGLKLRGAYITATLRCAPPANKPAPAERDNCREYLERELDLLTDVQVILTLGAYAFNHILRILRRQERGKELGRGRGHRVPSPMPKFVHGGVVELGPGRPVVIASYHPSQQNTFTGKLTPSMLDQVFSRARAFAGPRT